MSTSLSTSLSSVQPAQPSGTPDIIIPREPVPLVPDSGSAARPPDSDDAALAAARRALADEDGQLLDQPQGQHPLAQPIMVPKERLDEVLAAARANASAAEEWRNRALYMEGALTAAQRQPAPAPAAAAQAPPPREAPRTVDQEILAQQTIVMNAAQAFDRGEILAADLARVQFSAGNIISGLREQALARWMQSQIPVPAPGIADAEILDQHSAALEQRHPWCAYLRADREWPWLESWVLDFFAKTGAPIVAGNAADALRTRALAAQLTDVLGPWLFPAKIAEVEALRAARQQQLQAPGAAPANPLPPAATARAPMPLAQFAAHPPNLQAAGTAGAAGEISEERIAMMTTEEICALPDAVRARYLQ